VNTNDKPAPTAPPAAAAKPAEPELRLIRRSCFQSAEDVNLASLLAARMPSIPEALKQNRIELVRLVRNFGDSSTPRARRSSARSTILG